MIKKIRKECENYNSDIQSFQSSEEKGYESIRVNEVSIDKYKSQNHPALGERNSTITFYYYTGGGITEGGETLFKIERVNYIAAHKEYYEYYFNANGQLFFYFESLEYADIAEVRLYFNDEKLIEHRINSSTRDERYKGDSLSQYDAREVMEKIERLKKALTHFFY